MTKIFNPKGTLKKDDKYKTKIELAEEIINYLVTFGFQIKLVLADSLDGESSSLINTLTKNNFNYIVLFQLELIMEFGCHQGRE